MSRRRVVGFSVEQHKSAELRCRDIEAALLALMQEVMSGYARCADIDSALRLLAGVQRLRYKMSGYPVTDPLPPRVAELVSLGFSRTDARAIAADYQLFLEVTRKVRP
jgi:hypothetical protein